MRSPLFHCSLERASLKRVEHRYTKLRSLFFYHRSFSSAHARSDSHGYLLSHRFNLSELIWIEDEHFSTSGRMQAPFSLRSPVADLHPRPFRRDMLPHLIIMAPRSSPTFTQGLLLSPLIAFEFWFLPSHLVFCPYPPFPIQKWLIKIPLSQDRFVLQKESVFTVSRASRQRYG